MTKYGKTGFRRALGSSPHLPGVRGMISKRLVTYKLGESFRSNSKTGEGDITGTSVRAPETWSTWLLTTSASGASSADIAHQEIKTRMRMRHWSSGTKLPQSAITRDGAGITARCSLAHFHHGSCNETHYGYAGKTVDH